MKHIGILTLPLSSNYGGILQAYALQTHLEDEGYHPELINLRYSQTLKNKIWVALKTKMFGMPPQAPLLPHEKRRQAQLQGLTSFQHHKLRSTPPLLSAAEIALHYDAIIVGSDQVWRKEYAGKLLYHFFLDFVTVPSVRRISYAASFGVSDWAYTQDETARLAHLLGQFDAVSVREDSGVELCHKHLSRTAEHVVDPTLLLEARRYHDLMGGSASHNLEGPLYCYILDSSPAIKEFCRATAKSLNLAMTEINPGSYDLSASAYPSMATWLRSFAEASFVITDSFHGTIFAILFNKPFISLCNKARGATRFYSLLKLFSLEERLVTDVAAVDPELLRKPISWSDVHRVLEHQRTIGKRFLGAAIEQREDRVTQVA